MARQKVALLTAGGLAPCLSAAVGLLIERYTKQVPKVAIIGYRGGYAGILKGDAVTVTPAMREHASVLLKHGGSPLGNSRVKLSNVDDCVKRGLVVAGEVPLAVAGKQLIADGVTILHTIGGDDTNTAAAELAGWLANNGHALTVVGLPKTVDNDIVPIRQSMGAVTAAEQGAIFFDNIVNERTASLRTLIVHEVMGRHSGWLTAATARAWRKRLDSLAFIAGFNLDRRQKDIDGIYVPEIALDLDGESARLRRIMADKDCVNLFVSEGAAAAAIVAGIEARGDRVDRDAFGHVRLDKINVGDWIGRQLGPRIGAEKVLVQKSGYFARSAAANKEDLKLIGTMAELAVACGLEGKSGVVGHDLGNGGKLRAIELSRIAGGRPFDTGEDWFLAMLEAIGQPLGKAVAEAHG